MTFRRSTVQVVVRNPAGEPRKGGRSGRRQTAVPAEQRNGDR
jgi:hypothetical protein